MRLELHILGLHAKLFGENLLWSKLDAKDLIITHEYSGEFIILFKIITRMKLLFSNYLGDYSYSFQGSSELISITVTVSLFSCRMELQDIIPFGNSQAFLAIAVT